MKIRKIYLFTALFIFLCCMLLINNYYSSDLYITTVQIDQKEQKNGTYTISGSTLDQKALIFRFNEKDIVNVKINPNQNEEMNISNLWDYIEVEKDYYIVFNVLRFPYKLFDNDIKLRQIHLY